VGTSRRALGALALCAVVWASAGCFGYNKSAKRWAYAGDTVLILGGGAAIAGDLLTKDDPPMTMPGMKEPYESPVGGALVAGVMLATAGIIGIIINATRPDVKSSR